MSRLSRLKDRAAVWSMRFVPRRTRYWITIHEMGKATRSFKGHIPRANLGQILDHLDAPKDLRP